MKILLLLSSAGSGGAERVAVSLANAWAARGDRVSLMPTFSARGDCVYDVSSTVNIIYLADLVSKSDRTLVGRVRRFLALRKFIASECPDAIVSFMSLINVVAIMSSLGYSIPVVICERTDPFVFPMPSWLRLICRLCYPFAKALVVQTQAVADKYASASWAKSRVWVIPNPVPSQMRIAQHRGSGNAGVFRLLGCGRLDEGKQFSMLISVFSRLALRNPKWDLRIIGDGLLRSSLQSQISTLNLNARVELAGQSNSVDGEFVQADIFTLTSRYEGFPNVLLEAMAVGLPCVAFDCPSGPKEITMDGQLAILVPLNDEHALEMALEQLMHDADLRQRLGGLARDAILRRFSIDIVIEQWDRLFHDLTVAS